MTKSIDIRNTKALAKANIVGEELLKWVRENNYPPTVAVQILISIMGGVLAGFRGKDRATVSVYMVREVLKLPEKIHEFEEFNSVKDGK